MSREARAVVDLAALAANLRVARDAAPDARILAVIKANAYGHGLLPAARALADADGYAVSCLEEAIPLREAGIRAPILLLDGFYAADELPLFERYQLDCVVHAPWQVEVLEAARLGRPLSVWIKVDSGMHRLGLSPEELTRWHPRLAACPSVAGHIRLMTHLACADDRNSDYTLKQLALFDTATAGLAGERSIGNSAGLLAWPGARADWIRPGIMLYGASPFADGMAGPALTPVMTFTSRLIAVRAARKGDPIGYAGTYVCPEDMPFGVVAVGYGDGYPRHAPSGTPVLVNGQRSQVIGRVSMDLLCVDLRGIDQPRPGDLVTLWGRGLPVEEVAEACGTIAYELLCKLTRRVHFEYRDHG